MKILRKHKLSGVELRTNCHSNYDNWETNEHLGLVRFNLSLTPSTTEHNNLPPFICHRLIFTESWQTHTHTLSRGKKAFSSCCMQPRKGQVAQKAERKRSSCWLHILWQLGDISPTATLYPITAADTTLWQRCSYFLGIKICLYHLLLIFHIFSRLSKAVDGSKGLF